MSNEPLCDFCGVPRVSHHFPARDFYVREPPEVIEAFGQYKSASFWAACPECAALIIADDYVALADRAVQVFPIPYPTIRENVVSIHEQFRAHRTGPPKEKAT